LTSSIDLPSLGWSDTFEQARLDADRPDLMPARVIADHGEVVRILGPAGAASVRPGADPPCVGDWVLVAASVGDAPGIVVHRLPRRTELVRQAAGTVTRRQTVAANLDVVFVVTDMADDFNPRRLERYLAAVHAGGATPVVVLNKSDLALGNEGRFLRQLDPDWTVVMTSAVLDLGVDELRAHLGPGRTAGFVGSSGVGKSSLVNAVIGEAVQRVDHIAEDGRGRHTTTHRELRVLPDGGGVIIDTPGMRELALWDADGVDAVFADLVALADGCRFRDCAHETEPGCALLDAIERGEVDASRLRNWKKLQRQARRQAVRMDQALQRRESRALGKLYRRVQKHKERNRDG
jgi:ribosome biogenesis GTPase